MLGRHPVGRHRTLGPGALRRRQAVRTALRSLVLDLSVRPRRRAQFSRAPVSLGGAGTFYSSQEKGNGAVSGKPGRSGRKSFVATTEQRNNVKILVGLGVPQAMICQLVVNPQTGKPLDEGTLKKHFPREIAVGAAELHARMGELYGGEYLRDDAAGRHTADQERVVARNAVDLLRGSLPPDSCGVRPGG